MTKAEAIFAKWKAVAATEPSSEIERDIRVVVREHEEAEAARLGDHLSRCGVPTVILEAAKSPSLPTPATAAVNAWLPGTESFLVLLGRPGSGKSVAAATILRAARKSTAFLGSDGPVATWRYSSRGGLFVRAGALATGVFADEGRARFERSLAVQFLVLDELGAERIDNSGIWLSMLDELIGHREANRLRTVITSNLTLAQFAERYGDRVVSRLRGAGNVVGCGDTDLRKLAR